MFESYLTPHAEGDAAGIDTGSEPRKRGGQIRTMVALSLQLFSDLPIRELIGSVVANPSVK